MRNLKKFLALVLATLMVVSAAATVSAYAVFDDVEDDNQYAEAIGKLVEYNITNGIGDGKFGVDNEVERYQMALFMARALNPNETDWQSGMAIFDDVEEWYGAIAYAYMNGIVTGIGNNQFAPHNGIRYQDALIMALRALGYKVDTTGDPYWLAAYQQAVEIGLTNNVAVTKGDKTLTRAETAQLICNMLDATPADGGLTIAQKNFGAEVITPEPAKTEDVYVITATSKQAFDGSSDKVADADYVTLQALNSDGTLGDGFYAKFDTLGYGEDIAPDDVIGASVVLVNYNDDDNSYEKAIPNAVDVVLTTDSNVKIDDSKTKITIDGKVYYIVKKYTGNVLKNEIIIKDETGTASSNSLNNVNKLLYNEAGYIVAPDADATVLAKPAGITNANGAALYRLASATGASRLYTAAELLEVDAVKTAYNSVTKSDKYTDVEKINAASRIVLFDDNGDEKYDRAVISPVYMSVYNNKDGNKINIVSNAFATSTEGVSINYSTSADVEKLVKGDVFTYTYNTQTKTINVLEVLPLKNGTIEKMNITGDSDSKYTVTISNAEDGEVAYKLASTNASGFGANFKAANAGELTGNDTIGKVVSKPAIKLVEWSNFNSTASMGATVKYYAYNNYIVYAESYDVEETFNLVAIKSINTVDNDGNIVADVYVDGKLVKDAVISEVIDSNTDKTVVLADLNSIRWSTVTGQYIGNNSAENKIFKGIPLEDGSYRLGVELKNNAVATASKKNGGFALYSANVDVLDGANNAIAFLDGITENGSKTQRIRTNDDTVYYFIKDGKLKVVTGSANDSIITTTSATKIYADKIGYSTVKDANGNVTQASGVASKVVVFDYADLEGFGIAATGDAIAYIPAKFANINKYEINTAAAFGLDASYEGAYYKYADVAINMSNGSKITLYSNDKLEAGKAYRIDSNNVVFDDAIELTDTSVFKAVPVAKTAITTDDQYITVTGVFDLDKEVSTIVGQNKNADKVDPKKNGDAKGLIADGKSATIYFLAKNNAAIDLKDGIFVAIFDMTEAPAPTTIKTSAKWTWNGTQTFAGVATDVVATTAKVSGNVYLAKNNVGEAISFDGYRADIAVAGKFNISAGTVTDVTITARNAVAPVDELKVTLDDDLSDNVVTFAIERNPVVDEWGETPRTFTAGQYTVTITISYGASDTATFEIPVTVPAAN